MSDQKDWANMIERIKELEAENKRLNAEIDIKAEYNMRYFEQLEELRGAAQAAVDWFNGEEDLECMHALAEHLEVEK